MATTTAAVEGAWPEVTQDDLRVDLEEVTAAVAQASQATTTSFSSQLAALPPLESFHDAAEVDVSAFIGIHDATVRGRAAASAQQLVLKALQLHVATFVLKLKTDAATLLPAASRPEEGHYDAEALKELQAQVLASLSAVDSLWHSARSDEDSAATRGALAAVAHAVATAADGREALEGAAEEAPIVVPEWWLSESLSTPLWQLPSQATATAEQASTAAEEAAAAAAEAAAAAAVADVASSEPGGGHAENGGHGGEDGAEAGSGSRAGVKVSLDGVPVTGAVDVVSLTELLAAHITEAEASVMRAPCSTKSAIDEFALDVASAVVGVNQAVVAVVDATLKREGMLCAAMPDSPTAVNVIVDVGPFQRGDAWVAGVRCRLQLSATVPVTASPGDSARVGIVSVHSSVPLALALPYFHAAPSEAAAAPDAPHTASGSLFLLTPEPPVG